MGFITLSDLAQVGMISLPRNSSRRNSGMGQWGTARARSAWGLGQAPAPAAPAPPTISSISPLSGGAGVYVTIYGANLSGATAVTFNGVPAQSFVVNSPNQITAVTPSGVVSGPVVVATPGGSVTAPNSFSATQPPPAITSVSPASGAVGAYVTILGANLTNASAVSFNGVPAQSVTVNGPGQITVVVPTGATSGIVSVTTPGGVVASPSTFSVIGSTGGVSSTALVQQAVDAVVRAAGLPDSSPSSYTLTNLQAIQANAVSHGVDPSQVIPLIRQEVMLHRLSVTDPYPAGDLTELATRLSAQSMPTAPAFQQPTFQPQPSFQPQPPTFQPALQQPVAPPSFQPAQADSSDNARHGGRRSGHGGGYDSGPFAGLPAWAPAAGAAVLGTLAIIGVAAIVTRK